PNNTAVHLPHTLASNNAAELVAILLSIQQNQSTKIIKIISDSQYSIDALTIHLQEWANQGFIEIKNADILRTLYITLITSPNVILLKKVKDHSGDTGNEGADRLAATGACKPHPDHLDLSKGEWAKSLGAKPSCMTQSKLYKAIKCQKTTIKCAASQHNIDTTAYALEENTGSCPTPETIWKSILYGTTLTKKVKTFLWKTLHGSHKIGTF
ncbi:hypothetical protein BDQ17DRAFT_1266240, partial [Cyathus striatus]